MKKYRLYEITEGEEHNIEFDLPTDIYVTEIANKYGSRQPIRRGWGGEWQLGSSSEVWMDGRYGYVPVFDSDEVYE